MKTRPGAIKKHEKPPGTMKNRPVTKKPTGNFKSQPGTMIYPQNPPGTLKKQSETLKTHLEP